MNAAAQVPAPAINFDLRVGQYIQLRNKIKEIKDRQKAELQPYADAMEKLEGVILHWLNQTGQENARTAHGTVYKLQQTSASLEDADEFMRFVIGSERWDLLDRKPNKTAVADFLEAQGALPPGVKWSAMAGVGFRSPTKK